jgi:hypothetical protein
MLQSDRIEQRITIHLFPQFNKESLFRGIFWFPLFKLSYVLFLAMKSKNLLFWQNGDSLCRRTSHLRIA